jgi:hypothetical protein
MGAEAVAPGAGAVVRLGLQLVPVRRAGVFVDGLGERLATARLGIGDAVLGVHLALGGLGDIADEIDAATRHAHRLSSVFAVCPAGPTA